MPVAVLGLVVCCVLGLLWGTDMLTPGQRRLLSDLVLIPLAAAVAATAWWRSRLVKDPAERRAWQRLAVAGVLWTLAESTWSVVNQLTASDSSVSVADVFYLLALPFAGAALFGLPQRSSSPAERLRTLLSSLVVGLAVVFIAGELVVPAVLPMVSGEPLELAVAVAYPFGDVVLAAISLISLVRMGNRFSPPLVLLSLGLISYAIADAWYFVAVARDNYESGGILDVGWALGYVLFALAALAPGPSAERSRAWSQLDAPVGYASLVVYLPLLAAVVIGVANVQPDSVAAVLTGSAMLVLFGVRQALLSVDNARLRRALGNRVAQLEERSTALRRLALQNERIVHSVVDGVLGVDSTGRITFANEAAVHMLGRPRQVLLGLSQQSVLAADQQARGVSTPVTSDPPSEKPAVEAPTESDTVVAAALASGISSGSATTECVRADGSRFPVELAVGPILDQNGSVEGAVVVFRDISARRAVERMKDEFVSVVSHELRTPLTAIRGALGLLSNGAGGELSGRGKRMVTIALTSSERLTRLINDILDVERMESGQLSLHLEDLPVRGLVEKAAEQLRVVAAENGVAVVVGEVEGTVRADADRVQQSLINLIGNAIKFSSSGGVVRVDARLDGSFVLFTVSDHGRGIPSHKLTTIFERFEQVDSSDARERGGTGLGLAITKDLILLHGGRIWVDSEVGTGTTFSFTLPVAGVAAAGAPQADATEAPRADSAATAAGPQLATTGAVAPGQVGRGDVLVDQVGRDQAVPGRAAETSAAPVNLCTVQSDIAWAPRAR